MTKNKKYIKFQGDMLNFSGFIQVFVFTTNHHLKMYRYTANLLPQFSLKEDNFCDILFASVCSETLVKERSSLLNGTICFKGVDWPLLTTE